MHTTCVWCAPHKVRIRAHSCASLRGHTPLADCAAADFCRLQATNNGATATADKAMGNGPVPTVKIDNLNDPFATVVRAWCNLNNSGHVCSPAACRLGC